MEAEACDRDCRLAYYWVAYPISGGWYCHTHDRAVAGTDGLVDLRKGRN